MRQSIRLNMSCNSNLHECDDTFRVLNKEDRSTLKHRKLVIEESCNEWLGSRRSLVLRWERKILRMRKTMIYI